MKNRIKLFLPLLFIIQFLTGCSITLYDEALNYADNGNYDQAIAKFKQALIAEPQNPDIQRELGIAFYKSKDFANAISSLNNALQLNSNDGTSIFYLGLSYESVPDYDNALKYYKNYIIGGYSSGNNVEIIEGRIQWIANKKIEEDVKKALLVENEIKADTIQANSLAVLYFQNIGNNKALDPLQKGLTEMLITDLSKVKDLRVVERVKLQKLLDEIGLGQSGLVAENTAPRVGKIFGVNKLVKGTFLDFDSTNFRMGVGMIGTKTGSYQDLTNVSGSLEDLFKLEKELTFSVVDEMGIKLTDEEREAIQIIPTESYLAFVAYSKGLDLEDQGRYNEAAEQYREAFSIDPFFNAAEQKYQQVEIIDNAKDVGNVEQQIQSSTAQYSQSTMERLIESNYQLTGETVTGRDDHNPTTSSDFGRGVRVDIEIVIPRR